MCAIAGIFTTARGPDPALLARMLDLQGHRGPDGTRCWVDGPIGLGHARLALVDLAGGAQPLASEDGSVQVICNGEIYNHRELRQALIARGHRMRSASDSEVIVHLYEEQGAAMLDRLNGPFALAVWDTRRQALLLARDRAGMRPLHWTHLPDGSLAFASETKALLALPGVERAPDPAGLQQLFHWWGTVGERTVFRGIRQLPPGHTLVVEDPRAPQLRRWWSWNFEPDPTLARCPEEELAQALQERLARAVALQRQADLPVGLYLSGGLDSTALAALMAQDGSPPHSWGLRFEDPRFDEGPAQQQAAEALGLAHQAVHSTGARRAADLPRVVWHAETPVLRMAPAAMLALAAATRQAGCKAVISGEGADEILAGYDLFKEARVRRFMAREPGSRARAAMLSRLYGYLPDSPTSARSLAAARWQAEAGDSEDPLFAHRGRMQAGGRIDALWSPAWRAELAAHGGAALDAAYAALLPPGSARWPALGRDQLGEALTLLPGYLLSTQGDRMAMAHGIELRHPFLDSELVDWVGRLPPARKLRGLREKHLLRKAMHARLPATLRDRPKQPFRAPDSTSFFDAEGRLPDWAQALTQPQALERIGWFDVPRVQRLLDKGRAGRIIGFADNMALVGLLSMLLWHQQFLEASFPVRGWVGA